MQMFEEEVGPRSSKCKTAYKGVTLGLQIIQVICVATLSIMIGVVIGDLQKLITERINNVTDTANRVANHLIFDLDVFLQIAHNTSQRALVDMDTIAQDMNTLIQIISLMGGRVQKICKG